MTILARNTTFVDGNSLSSSDLHTELDWLYSGLIPAQLEDESSDATAHQAMSDPTGGALPASLKEEIQQLRFKIDEIQGTTHWYTAAPDDLTNLNSTVAGIVTVIGAPTSAWIDTSYTVAGMWGGGLTQSSDSISIGTTAILESMLGTSAVTETKINDGAVVTAKIGTSAVTEAKINNGAVTESKLGDSAVAQAKLKTSTGSVSQAAASWAQQTLSGGEYGFYPQLRVGSTGYENGASLALEGANGPNDIPTSYATIIYLLGSSNSTVYAQQRYVTSSGEVHWIFILRDKGTKKIVSMWQAPDHPCFGNGGKPSLMPHPFGSYDKDAHEIIVINPTDEEVSEMKKKCAGGEEEADLDLLQVIEQEYEIDESSNPAWPTKAVTVGLPPDWDEAWYSGMLVNPSKKVIPKPDYVLCKSLKLKKAI